MTNSKREKVVFILCVIFLRLLIRSN